MKEEQEVPDIFSKVTQSYGIFRDHRIYISLVWTCWIKDKILQKIEGRYCDSCPCLRKPLFVTAAYIPVVRHNVPPDPLL